MEDFEAKLVARFSRVLGNVHGEAPGENWSPTITAQSFVDTTTDPLETWLVEDGWLNNPKGTTFVLLRVTYHPGYAKKYYVTDRLAMEDPIASTCGIILLALGLGMNLHHSHYGPKGFHVFMRREEDVYQQLPPIEDARP